MHELGGSEVWSSSRRLGINHPSKKKHNKHSRRFARWFLCVCVYVCGVRAPYFPVSFLGLSSSPFFFFYFFVSLSKVQVLSLVAGTCSSSSIAQAGFDNCESTSDSIDTGAPVGSNIFCFVLLQIGYMELFLLQRCAA
jgi:hypothetical protein